MTARVLLPLTALAVGMIANAQVLWRPPKQMSISDWTWGPGGESRAPRPPFRFKSENMGGTNPKVDVWDANGRWWMVKFGGEVRAETFSSRLLYVTGYLAESTYFVRSGVIEGAHDLKRAKPFIGKDGQFRDARFKLRDEALVYIDSMPWSWTDNPFVGTPELSGLKVLIMLASNWDAKDGRDGNGSNTAVFKDRSNGETLVYSFDDWGDSFGSWGGFLRRTRWDASGYERDTPRFVAVANNGSVAWGFDGKHGSDVRAGITIDDIRWLLPYLTRITDLELKAGLAASGGTQDECSHFAGLIRARITQLELVVKNFPPNSAVRAH
jgi:hypothetical protein